MRNVIFILISALFFAACTTAPQSASNTYKNSYKYNSKYKNNVNNELASELNLAKYKNTRIGGDCSGLVSVINKNNDEIYFAPSELNKYFSSGRKSQAIFDLYKSKNQISHHSPKAGDLVFFNNTTKNTRRAKKELITHIGVISKVNKDGSVEFLHNIRGKNVVSVMDLNSPESHAKNGKKINAYIIAGCGNSASCLASKRFSGFGIVSK